MPADPTTSLEENHGKRENLCIFCIFQCAKLYFSQIFAHFCVAVRHVKMNGFVFLLPDFKDWSLLPICDGKLGSQGLTNVHSRG